MDAEFREQVRVQQRELYHTQGQYEKRCLRVKCPDCDKEMGVPGLRALVNNQSCKGRNLEFKQLLSYSRFIHWLHITSLFRCFIFKFSIQYFW